MRHVKGSVLEHVPAPVGRLTVAPAAAGIGGKEIAGPGMHPRFPVPGGAVRRLGGQPGGMRQDKTGQENGEQRRKEEIARFHGTILVPGFAAASCGSPSMIIPPVGGFHFFKHVITSSLIATPMPDRRLPSFFSVNGAQV
jgi:hypothetical protein